MKKTILNSLFILATVFVFAQNSEQLITATLYDGSIIKGKGNLPEIQLQTNYGVLKIPAESISSIEFGLSASESEKKKFQPLIEQLMSNDENTRKNAFNKIIEESPVILPVIEEYMYKEGFVEIERPYNLTQAYNVLQSKYQLNSMQKEDVLYIENGYYIGGKSNVGPLTLETSYGKVTIQKNLIARMELISLKKGKASKTFILEANKHIYGNSNGGWLNTGIYVVTGQKLTISAKGNIVLASLSNKTATPDGINEYNGGNVEDDGSVQYGTLIYKIGENGSFKKAGSFKTEIASETGLLFLSIYETIYDPKNTGKYIVTVKVE
ncbi:MAG: hypothetical protein D6707_08835 [Bacteroidetes bacterium]|nr:MAG: hypothetical protein D6707_08835 [Bacteroidota bacterium]